MRARISTRMGQAEVDRAWLLDSIWSFSRVRQSINWYRFLGREKITNTFRTLFNFYEVITFKRPLQITFKALPVLSLVVLRLALHFIDHYFAD